MIMKIKNAFSRNILITLAFGFSSGLPLALVFGTLSFWLKDYHVAYRTIGAFSLLRLPYSFKWLWAPLVETVRLPLLGRLGRRRSWALLAQAGLLLSIVWLSALNPDTEIGAMAATALAVSLFSATQDIVLDAFRVELFADSDEREVDGATMYVLGYRLGNIMSGAISIGLAAIMSWNTVYLINAMFLLLGMAAVLYAKEPKRQKTVIPQAEKLWQYALFEPIKQFMQKPYWVVALLIVFTYRLSDAYFGPMAYPFYDDLGFSKAEIAYITKLYGMAATIAGGLAGGYIINKTGLLRGLLLFAVIQGLTTALYIPLYYAGHHVFYLMFTISLENLSSGMATTAIIAFMSILCNRGYTATQYALLSSLPGFARDVVAASSGKVLEMTSWPVFFTISALLAMPAVILCLYLYKKRPDYLMNA